MQKLSACLLPFVAPTAWAVVVLGQTPAMLTLHVKNQDGLVVQNADVTIRPAHPVHFGLPGQAQPRPSMFVTRTNADGQAQAYRAELEKTFLSGKFVLTVRAPGYEPYSRLFELSDPKPPEIVLHPLPPQK